MIVVEGPDGAGKTTLIRRLARELDLEVAPRVVSKDAEAMVDLKAWVELSNRQGFQHMIFDRHRLISEPIYGPLLREAPEPGFRDMSWFFSQLLAFYGLEPIIVYCLPPFNVAWGNVKNDPENKVVSDPEVYRQLWGAYFNKAMTDMVHYEYSWVHDYTNPAAEISYRSLTQSITKRIKETTR